MNMRKKSSLFFPYFIWHKLSCFTYLSNLSNFWLRNLFHLFFKKWGKNLQTRYILSLKESVFVLFSNSRLFVYFEDPKVNKKVKGFSKYAVSKQSLNFRSFEPRFFSFQIIFSVHQQPILTFFMSLFKQLSSCWFVKYNLANLLSKRLQGYF